MTIIDAEEAAVSVRRASGRPGALALEDTPCCPACDAEPSQQSTLARRRDGALEIVILVCMRCAKDHPVWL